MERRVGGNNKGVFIMSQRGGKRSSFLPFLLYSFVRLSHYFLQKKKLKHFNKYLRGHSYRSCAETLNVCASVTNNEIIICVNATEELALRT